MKQIIFVFGVLAATLIGAAQAQFTVGGVTGGAPTTDVNCYGDADGKILAYSSGWTAADCGIYSQVCNANQFTCPPANTLCVDGQFCGAGGPHVAITSPSATQTVALQAVNTDPTINPLGCPNASAGIPYSCAVIALDAEGNTLTYATDAQAITGWLSIDSNTGILSGTPNVSGAVPAFNVTVTDDFTGSATVASNSFSVANTPPVFASVNCPVATVGNNYLCGTGASDSESHSLTYEKVAGPDWIQIASNGNLTADTVGSSTSVIRIRATDGYDSTISTDYNVALNTAPTINSILCINGVAGSAYNCSISSSDAESDSLAFSLTNAPSWASLNSNGDITGNTPVQGEYTGIVITVSDGNVSTNSNPFSITIDPNTATILADIASTITTDDLDNLVTLGVSNGLINDLKTNSTCGASGTESCLAAFNAQKTTSSCTLENGNAATGVQMQAYIGCVMVEHHTALVASAALGGSDAITSGCNQPANLPLPGTCGHSQWTCTLVTAPGDWTLNGMDIVVPASYSGSGSQTVSIEMSLGIYAPAYTKTVSKTYNVAQAVAGANNGYKSYSDAGLNRYLAWQRCTNRGGRLATRGEYSSNIGGLTGRMIFASSPTEGAPNNTNSSSPTQYKHPWNTCQGGWPPRSKKRNNSWWCGGSQFSGITYACAGLPACD